MLWKINRLQSASSVFGIIGPTSQKPPLVHSSSANSGQSKVLQLLSFSFGPMLGQCQDGNNDVLPTTLTITQRWPIDMMLSGNIQAIGDILILICILFSFVQRVVRDRSYDKLKGVWVITWALYDSISNF